MVKTYANIIIIPELMDYILPLVMDEYQQLEKSILEQGCRDSLVVWEKSPSELILVDGHNRYHICRKNNVSFKIVKLNFTDIEEVKAWMIDNQLGRRNLNPDQLSYYRGLKYLAIKKNKGGYSYVKSKGQNELSTSELLSEQFKVSESTIKRDAKFAEGLENIGRSNQSLKRKILLGDVKVKKSDIQVFTDSFGAMNLKIRNEADLQNKARILKNEILDEVESGIQKIVRNRRVSAIEVLQSKEPLFIEREQMLTKIKGMILASINRAINERDVDAIGELKKLIERLEHELFE